MRRSLTLVVLLCVSCAATHAQGPAAAPQPPFTPEDAARGLRLAELSLELRKQIGDFMAPAEPFKIIGNLYFVGMANGESYLLTSPEGHILFGAGFEKTAAQVEANIAALGFELTDIKVILFKPNSLLLNLSILLWLQQLVHH